MKKPGDIIILHECATINVNHMICEWFLRYEVHQQFFVILAHFLLFYPTNNPKNQNFENLKVIIECYTVPEIWHVTDVLVIFHFGL